MKETNIFTHLLVHESIFDHLHVHLSACAAARIEALNVPTLSGAAQEEMHCFLKNVHGEAAQVSMLCRSSRLL